MKTIALYVLALGGGAAAGAVGVSSWNIFLGDAAHVEAEATPEDESGSAPEDPEGDSVPEGAEPESGQDPVQVASTDTGTGEAEDRGEDEPDGSEDSEAEAALVEETSPRVQTVAAVEVPPVPDADSIARATLNYQRLARIFAAMSPAEAASVLAQLEDSQLEGILLAMQSRNAAPILAEMDPGRAASVSRRVLELNR